ncbi:MAG: hypothetical protein M3Q88_03125 [Pseudomonadota bacterium]|nr:hypothetical protein [Pseudomonadota bacterium]
MTSKQAVLAAAIALSLSSCAGGGASALGFGTYALVRAREIGVGNNSLRVTPPREWNRQHGQLFVDIREVEDWTLNGPLLDGISFVTGLRSGKSLVRQRRRDDRQVPYYRSNMTAPEIAAMLESLFRVRGGTIDFKTLALAPRTFLGVPGYQFDFEHLDGDEVWRRGRAVGATINGRLYLILYDATRAHYFDTALPDFEAIVASARLAR